MKRSEKIISAVLTMAFGVLLIVMRGNFISVLMTIAGVSFIVLGVVDILERMMPPAVIKIVGGLLLIICGWAVVEAVLYVLAAILLVVGVLLLYDMLKNRRVCARSLYALCEYAVPALCIVIGIVLLFHSLISKSFVFITCGLLVIVLGGVLLFNVFSKDED